MAILALGLAFVSYDHALIRASELGPTTGVTLASLSWNAAGLVTIGVDQLDSVATAFERLIQQDYSEPSELKSIDIDASGSFPALTVACVQTGDLPTGFTVGSWSPDLGTARSFAKLVRDRGIGVEWAPPEA